MGSLALGFIGLVDWITKQVAEFSALGEMQHWIGICLPIAGALATIAVFEAFPSSFRGHGVSRIMLAVHREKSILPLSVAPRQWMGSTATIASGGSAGPEGPIVAIGATVGSHFAGWLRLDAGRRTTLLGCGAAAGLAAVFNAPLAGAFFVLEVILRDFTARTLTPIIVAAVAATATAQTILQSQTPIFGISAAQFDQTPLSLIHAPQYALLGVIIGIAAAGFAFLMKSAHQFFQSMHAPRIVKPLIGAALLVVCGFIWQWASADGTNALPPFYGSGYGLIERLIHQPSATEQGALMLMGSLAILAMMKALATALTLGSGGAGGLFAPGLVIGATLGATLSAVTHAIEWIPDISPLHAVIVGMGSFVAAGAHAPLAGAFLVYEFTHSYAILMPLLLAAVVATVAARLVWRESIYSAELSALNIRLTTIGDHAVLRNTLIRDVPLLPAHSIQAEMCAEDLVDLGERTAAHDFTVVDAVGRYRAFVCGSDVRSALIYREALRLLTVAELERTDFAPLESNDTLDTALERFSRHETQTLPVVDPLTRHPIGLLSRSQIMTIYNRQAATR